MALGKSLTSREYGTYSLIGSLSAMSGATTLSAFQYFNRHVPGRELREGLSLFKSVLVPQTILLTTAFAFLFFFSGLRGEFARIMEISSQPALFLLIAAILLLDGIATEFMRYLYARKEIERGNIVTFFQNSFWAFLLFLLFLATPQWIDFLVVLNVWLAGLILAVGYSIWKTGFKDLLKVPWSMGTYMSAIRFGLPFIMTYSASTALSFGRFFLAGIHSAEEVGIFSYHYNIIAMIGALSSPLIGNPIDPYAVEAYNHGRYEHSSILLTASLKYRLFLVIPLLTAAASCSESLIRFLAKEQFVASPWLLFSMVPIPVLLTLASSLERIYFLEKRMAIAGLCHLAGGIVQVAAFPLLIPIHPLYGIVTAINVGLLIQTVFLWTFSRGGQLSIQTNGWKMFLATVISGITGWIISRTTILFPPAIALILAASSAVIGFIIPIFFLRLLPPSEFKALHGIIRGKDGEKKKEQPLAAASLEG
ncbi:MAG: hypothetical protein NC910_01575 [Candidatus Omnitrophica bacterium]|nr:hypothetical protein [Candidatus Omnitrophota bacterium]